MARYIAAACTFALIYWVVNGAAVCKGEITLPINTSRVHIGDEPDLGPTRFPDWGPFVGTTWETSFTLPLNPTNTTLHVESFDVEAPPDFQDRVLLNGTYVGDLAYAGPPNWYSAANAMPVLATLLHAGENTLRIESGYAQGIYDHPTYDDFGVGQITLSYTPEPTGLSVVSLAFAHLTVLRVRRPTR
jgi:hypothetical protein